MPDAREQKLLKLAIRLLLPIFALGGFGGIAGVVYANWSSRPILHSAWSPSGKYRASVIQLSGSDGCTLNTSYVVMVERTWHRVYTGSTLAFCFAGPPQSLSVRWSSDHDLVVVCHSCDQDSIRYNPNNWGELNFRYDLGVD